MSILPFNNVILTAEAVSLVMLLIVLYALFFEAKLRDKITKNFIICVVFTSLALISDMFCWRLEDLPGYDTFIFFCCLCSFLFSVSAMIAVVHYIQRTYDNATEETIHAKIITTFNIIGIVIIIIGTFSGKCFTVEDGIFIEGPLYSVSAICCFISIIYMLVLLIIKFKEIGIHDACVLLAYLLIPSVAAIIETIFPKLCFTLVASAFGELIVYITIQSKHVTEIETREKLTAEMSRKDIMTGFLNRLSMNEAVEELEDEADCCLAFLDINGLKYTNDTFGHKEGDNRIVHFAEVMKRFFPVDCLFRMSGDEFIVFSKEIPKPKFESISCKLKREFEADNDLASIGTAYGKGKDILELVNIAEAEMYKDKKLCHDRHPEYER